MGVVHPIYICFSEDDVVWIQYCAPRGTYIRGVHRDPRWVPCFLGVIVTCTMTFSGLARFAKYGIDHPFYK